MLEKLRSKLEIIEKEIKTCKNNLIKEIEKEEMVPASNDLLLMRDLVEYKLIIKGIIAELEMEEK